MSKLEELINELCPDGVEYKTLGEIGYFYGGLSGKSKDDFSNGNAKFITYMNVYSNLAIDTEINDMVKIEDNEKQNLVEYGDILFTGSSETIDECGISSVLTKEPKENLYLNSFCFGFRLIDKDLLLPNFSKYLFRSDEIRKQIKRTASGVTRFNVSKKKMEQVVIPLPPLPVQQEIVRILDKFTELTAELTAELKARKKQYEYYREKLLTFGDEVEYKKIKDVYTRIKGTSITANKMKEIENYDGDIRIFAGGKTVINAFEEDIPNANITRVPAVLVQSRGIIDFIFYEKPFTFKNEMWAYTAENRTSVKYLYYVLKNSIQQFRDAASGMGSLPQISLKVTEEFVIPVPPLEEQERIVSILDRFDALCNDLTIGLPAEIEARQKQYEYYRDKLLSFKPLPSKDEEAVE